MYIRLIMNTRYWDKISNWALLLYQKSFLMVGLCNLYAFAHKYRYIFMWANRLISQVSFHRHNWRCSIIYIHIYMYHTGHTRAWTQISRWTNRRRYIWSHSDLRLGKVGSTRIRLLIVGVPCELPAILREDIHLRAWKVRVIKLLPHQLTLPMRVVISQAKRSALQDVQDTYYSKANGNIRERTIKSDISVAIFVNENVVSQIVRSQKRMRSLAGE